MAGSPDQAAWAAVSPEVRGSGWTGAAGQR